MMDHVKKLSFQKIRLNSNMALYYLVLGCWLLCCVHMVCMCCAQERSGYMDAGLHLDWKFYEISSKVTSAHERLVDSIPRGDGARRLFKKKKLKSPSRFIKS